MKGFIFKFVISAVKTIVKFSATRFYIGSFQLKVKLAKFQVIKRIYPPADAVTEYVYTISVALHINSVDDTLNAGSVYEPALYVQM